MILVNRNTTFCVFFRHGSRVCSKNTNVDFLRCIRYGCNRAICISGIFSGAFLINILDKLTPHLHKLTGLDDKAEPGKYDKVKDAVHTAIMMTAVMTVVFTALGITIAPTMLRLMKTPADVFPESMRFSADRGF